MCHRHEYSRPFLVSFDVALVASWLAAFASQDCAEPSSGVLEAVPLLPEIRAPLHPLRLRTLPSRFLQLRPETQGEVKIVWSCSAVASSCQESVRLRCRRLLRPAPPPGGLFSWRLATTHPHHRRLQGSPISKAVLLEGFVQGSKRPLSRRSALFSSREAMSFPAPAHHPQTEACVASSATSSSFPGYLYSCADRCRGHGLGSPPRRQTTLTSVLFP